MSAEPCITLGGKPVHGVSAFQITYGNDGPVCAEHTLWTSGVLLRYRCALIPGHAGEHDWQPE